MKKHKKTKPFTIREALIDGVYKNYRKTVNMNFMELLYWARNPMSKKANISRRYIRHNLELLKTPKHKWNMKHVRHANKAIAYINKTKNIKAGNPISRECPYSRKTLNLKIFGYNPNKK